MVLSGLSVGMVNDLGEMRMCNASRVSSQVEKGVVGVVMLGMLKTKVLVL